MNGEILLLQANLAEAREELSDTSAECDRYAARVLEQDAEIKRLKSRITELEAR